MQESLLVNTTIFHYRILSRLGAGGMGEVYLAEDTKLDRRVAIKLLPPESTADEQAKKRLVREAKAAAKLDHPHICSIYEVGEEDGRSFIVMQYIEGETLASRMRSKSLELGECLGIAAQLADALAEAHSHEIIHRDIKPANIMLTARHQAKVMDFGLAKAVRDTSLTESEGVTESLLTEPGAIIGTVPYMSPEQVRGESLDARSDIFSFGAVLYEMITGHQPFAAESAAMTISAIVTREPAPLARFSRDVPSELERIVSKALRKDREQRYQTARDLLIDLESLRRHLEFEAQLERSKPPELRSTASVVPEPITVKTITKPTAHLTSKIGSLRSAMKLRPKGVLTSAAVLILAVTAAAYFYFAGHPKTTINSIAVLPFVNVGADPNTEYLSDGITDSLINSLSQLPRLKVMSRNSVFRYKGQEADAQAAGKQLGVRAVLTGRVTQRGDSLSIIAELVDARDNSHLWGEQYNRKLADLLAVQEEIAKEISEKLRLKLTGEEEKQLIKRYTNNTEAYQLYLKGRFYWNKRTTEGYKKAIEYFEQAIENDPSYALAYDGLADTYTMLGRFGVSPPKEVMAKAKAAAVKALEIDDQLAEAHASLAEVKWKYDWDFQGGEKEIERAIALNPNYAIAHFWNALYLAEVGRHGEAMASIRRAQELDPLSLIISGDTGMILYLARRYDEAIEQCRRTLEMDQNFFRARLWLGRAYEQKGMYEEAIAEFLKARQLDDNPITLAWIGHAYAASGKRSDALKVLDQLKQLSKQVYVDSYNVAAIHAALEEKDQAFELLEKAYVERSSWLSRLKVDPILDGLRSDPRFMDQMRRIGLVP
jgi:serine/threonine protein kinase/tetratricopeptide (TPR) repeat protein